MRLICQVTSVLCAAPYLHNHEQLIDRSLLVDNLAAQAIAPEHIADVCWLVLLYQDEVAYASGGQVVLVTYTHIHKNINTYIDQTNRRLERVFMLIV
ncbi:hypothetical protein EON63_09180 [archaeon]|nr:MAG: hypothetical protein EON63_09180 [archaeon]